MARRAAQFGGVYRRCDCPLRAPCPHPWYYRVRVGGEEVRRMVGPGAKGKATAWAKLREIRVRLMQEKHLGAGPGSRTTVAQFWPAHFEALRARLAPASLKNAKAHGAVILERLGARRLGSLTRADAEDFVTWLLNERKAKPATTNRYLATLSGFLRAAVERGHLQRNPVEKMRRAREEGRAAPFLSPEDILRLEAAAPDGWRPVVTLAVETGLRRGEIAALEPRDADLRRRMLVVRRSKSKRPREVALTARAVEALGAGDLRGDRIFPGDYAALSRSFGGWCEAAGLPRMRFHDLRHSWASALAHAGVPLPAIQKLGGWATLAMVQRYATHTPQDSGRAAAAALDRERAPQGAPKRASS